MFKKIYLKPALLTILALGVALKITNPSEEKHKQVLNANSSSIDRFSTWVETKLGTKPDLVYKDNFLYSSLKLDNNKNGIADSGDTTVTFGILGNVFGGGRK